MDVPAIAKVAFTSEDRVRDVIRNFNADGFGSLYPKYKGGRPPDFTLPQRRERTIGERFCLQRARHTPNNQLFGQATPGSPPCACRESRPWLSPAGLSS